jgi:hypothetical protein
VPGPDFEQLLLQAIDESLSSLGESSRQAIYYHLEKNFAIKKEQIPEKIEPFEDALKRIFGIGADFIETLIMKRLAEKVEPGANWQNPEIIRLSECVVTTKRSFLKKKNAQKIEVEMGQCEPIKVEG